MVVYKKSINKNIINFIFIIILLLKNLILYKIIEKFD